MVRIAPTIRNPGYARMGGNPRHPRWRAGPNRSDHAAYRRSERCPAGDLHRPLQRGGTGRGLPAPRRGRLRPGQAGPPQPDRGRGRDPGGLPAAVEPARPLRLRPGLSALLPAGAGPRPGRRRRALVELTAPAREPAMPCARPRRPTTCNARSGTWRWPTRSPRPWASCPRRSAGRLSWPTSTAAPTARWRELLDQPEGTVKSRIRNGMRRMRAVLADAGVTGSRRVMTHDEASDLLGAYALDAVDGDEYTELEEHLDTCPRCRAELDSLREVAAAMGNSVEPLPEGLWSQIAIRLPERQEGEEPPPMPQLARRGAAHRSAPPADGRTPRRRAPVDDHRRHRGGRRRRGRRARHRSGAGRQQGRQPAVGPGAPSAVDGDGRAVDARAPGRHPRRGLRTRQQAQVVVVPSGQGYLVSSTLPTPRPRPDVPAVGDRGEPARSPSACSVRSPGQAAFTMAGSTRPSHLSITAEPAGGSVFPTGSDHRHRDCLTPPRSC